jgi:hypothetical protein
MHMAIQEMSTVDSQSPAGVPSGSGDPNRAIIRSRIWSLRLPVGRQLRLAGLSQTRGVEDRPVFDLQMVEPGQFQRHSLACGDRAMIRSNCDRSSPQSCISSKAAGAVARQVRCPVPDRPRRKSRRSPCRSSRPPIEHRRAGRRVFFIRPSAIGDRTALWSQQNRMDCGKSPKLSPSAERRSG